MGKHFWVKHVDDRSHHKQSGCMWGLVHVLDYHHWQSNIRNMIQHRKYEGQTHSKCDWSPETKMHSHDAYEAEKLLEEKESPYLSTIRSRATKRRSLKAQLKALIAEEISQESENIQGKESSFKPNLQRTYSIHHLESLDDGFGKICRDWKHPIIFFPRKMENSATQLLDTTQCKAAGSHEANREKYNMSSPKDVAIPHSIQDPDVLEIFKVDKELLIKHLQDADESIVNFSRSALGLNKKAKFSKSRSFPVAEVSQRRKRKPLKLEYKQREVWSFPRKVKIQIANEAPRLDHSVYFSRRSDQLAGDIESNGQDTMIKQDKHRNNVVSAEIGSDAVKSESTSLARELPSESHRKAKNIVDRIGEKRDEIDIRKRTHRRSTSLKESPDKYARLFANTFQTDAQLNPSKSLKLTNEYGYASLYFRRIRSLSNVDSYYSNLNFEVLVDDPSGNDPTITAKENSSILRNREEEKIAIPFISEGENAPLNANAMAKCQQESVHGCTSTQIEEDGAILRLHTRDEDCEKMNDLKEEEDKLKKVDSLWEQETNCSGIVHQEELPDQVFVLDSDICLKETECPGVQLQISEDMEHRLGIDELNFSVGSIDLKSLQGESLSEKITKCLACDGCPRKNSDLYYVRHLLDQSGIAVDTSDITWHASDQLFSPWLFEELEACWPHEQHELTGWPNFYGCWHHQMLFDLVNEVLLEVYDISLPYYPKALSSSCHVRLFPVGNRIIEEVTTGIGTLLSLNPEEKRSLDSIMAHDLAHDHSWMNLQLDTEGIALELEDMIFNELLEEVICY